MAQSKRALLSCFVLFAQLACSSSELEWGDAVPSGGATSGRGGGAAGASGTPGSGGSGVVGVGGGALGGADGAASEGSPSPRGGEDSLGGGGSRAGGGAKGGADTGGGVSSGSGPDPYRRCDSNQSDNGGCDANARCGSANTCVPECRGGELPSPPEDCPEPLSGAAARLCSRRGCVLDCRSGATCPDGMVCDSELRSCRWP
ncbi:MAG TPA: hypothetical protein VEQ59_21485 [Polyangiaceae bacterium]|nr:hypothetical protein [Polyangiaceae bacterium]